MEVWSLKLSGPIVGCVALSLMPYEELAICLGSRP